MGHAFDTTEQRALHRRGFKLLGVAGGAALGVMLVALTPLDAQDNSPTIEQRLDTVPADTSVAATHVARHVALDDGVDWQRVLPDETAAGASIANYDR